ncbi:hypothetical protein C8F01DRAFT_1262759 [Mycena amicta]|nr:hypothetical protein C8F01DRAFT_1262759 [Mycena amicta]
MEPDLVFVCRPSSSQTRGDDDLNPQSRSKHRHRNIFSRVAPTVVLLDTRVRHPPVNDMYAPSVEIDIVPGLIFMSSWTSPIGRREHSRIIVIGACAQLQCTMLALFIYRIPIQPTHPALSVPRRRRLLVLRPSHPSLPSFTSDHRMAMATHNGSGNESTSQIHPSHGAHPQQPPRLIHPLLERICDAYSPLLGLPAA